MPEVAQTTTTENLSLARGTLSIAQAMKELNKPSPVSEAARTLAARAAEARAQRAQAEAAPSQEAEPGTTAEADPEVEAEPISEDNPVTEPDAEEPDASLTDETALDQELEPASPTIEIEGLGKLTADQVREGFMRQSDASRKWQEAAEMRKQAQAALETRIPELDKIIAALRPEVAQEPNWIEEAKSDPLGVFEKRARWEAKVKSLQEAETVRQREYAEHHKAAKNAMWNELRSGKLNKAWVNPKQLEADVTEMLKYSQQQGFNADDMASLTDPRLFAMLDKARRWDALQASRSEAQKRVVGKPAPVRPGARPTGTTPQDSSFRKERASMLGKTSMTAAEAIASMKQLAGLSRGRAQ